MRYFITLLFLGTAIPFFAQPAPSISKIDPPNWFAALPAPLLLLRWRAEYPELNSGDEQILYADGDTLVFARGEALDRGCTPGRGLVVLAVNKSDKPETVMFDNENTALTACTADKTLLGTAPARDEVKQQLTVQPGTSLQYWR